MTSAQAALAGTVPAARSGAEIAHPSLANRRAEGQEARGRIPPSSHADWRLAADLKDTPVAGLDAQLCGDAHLFNFGIFASPERRSMFDLNDFDETLPGTEPRRVACRACRRGGRR